jgi:hypothetical protein
MVTAHLSSYFGRLWVVSVALKEVSLRVYGFIQLYQTCARIIFYNCTIVYPSCFVYLFSSYCILCSCYDITEVKLGIKNLALSLFK